MGSTNYVRFKEDRTPCLGEIQDIVEDYLGPEMGTFEPTKNGKGFIMVLPGKPSFPFERHSELKPYFPHDSRFIEFGTIYEGKTLTITTRQADECTNAIADGLSRTLARFYGAELELAS